MGSVIQNQNSAARRIATSYSRSFGFSLIEILVVLAIVAILALMALPSGEGKINQVRLKESLKLLDNYKVQIENYYRISGEFPRENADAGLPEPEQIIGNYLQATYLTDGALHAQLGNKIHKQLKGYIVSLRPVFVPGISNAPISWICGYDSVPDGMLVAGENRTDVDAIHLPLSCR